MKREFLDIYEEELRFVREMGVEFAQSHPKIAGRLALGADEVPDPYVERLLEGFAFLTARVRLRMEAQYPEFTQSLLQLLYPNLVAPTPSAAVFEVTPDYRDSALAEGFTLPRGTSLIGRAQGRDTPCEFATTRALSIHPLKLDEIEYTENGAALLKWIPEAARRGEPPVAGLRLRFRTAIDAPIASLGLETLSLFAAGQDSRPDTLLETLVMRRAGFAVRAGLDPNFRHARSLSLRHSGFGDDEAMLPETAQTFSGHRLLQEAFILPEKFRFLELEGLGDALEGVDSRQFDIAIGLTAPLPDFEEAVPQDILRLHCVPVVNLFERRADRIAVSTTRNEHIVIVDRTQPDAFEVFSLSRCTGVARGKKDRLEFAPLFQPTTGVNTVSPYGYFHARRAPRVVSSDSVNREYLGTETYVRLSGSDGGPPPLDVDQLLVHTLCTNRGLPTRLSRKSRYSLQTRAPVKSMKPIVGPTPPQLPLAHGSSAWDLVNALSLNHLSFSESAEVNAAWLQRLLSLYLDHASRSKKQLASAFEGLSLRIINRRLPGEGPVSFGRGLELTLQADQDRARGMGVFTLASVLERFFARAATLNGFTQTGLTYHEGDAPIQWPVRAGQRHVV